MLLPTAPAQASPCCLERLRQHSTQAWSAVLHSALALPFQSGPPALFSLPCQSGPPALCMFGSALPARDSYPLLSSLYLASQGLLLLALLVQVGIALRGIILAWAVEAARQEGGLGVFAAGPARSKCMFVKGVQGIIKIQAVQATQQEDRLGGLRRTCKEHMRVCRMRARSHCSSECI
eukprot:1161129-Pelagomonas_calceolata.AAC.3